MIAACPTRALHRRARSTPPSRRCRRPGAPRARAGARRPARPPAAADPQRGARRGRLVRSRPRGPGRRGRRPRGRGGARCAAVRTLVAEETRARDARRRGRRLRAGARARTFNADDRGRLMDIRFLGHAAFALSDGDTTRADRSVPDRQPEGRRGGRRGRRRRTILLTHGHGDHYRRHGRHRQAHRRAGRGDRRARQRDRRGAASRHVFDPNLGGTVEFDWGSVRLVPAWHTSTTPKGTVNTPAGLRDRVRRQARLPPRRHRRCSATCSSPSSAATRSTWR